jgi:hypothetical protein
VQPLQKERIRQNERLAHYRRVPLDDQAADHAILTMYRENIIGVQRIADVLGQWERPQHDWGDKTAWRLFNAATFARAGKVAERPALTQHLHEVLQGVCNEIVVQ